MTIWSIIVKPTGRTFGVFVRVEGKPLELLEGGFFKQSAAMAARRLWEQRTQREIAARKVKR